MRSRAAFTLSLLLLVIGAFAFRLPALGNRPMHSDEAVHAFKFRELWKRGVYRYDPDEFHGPTIYYAALPSIWLHGRRDFAATTEADYRLPMAVFGAAMVLLLLLIVDALGRRPMLWSALLLCISPAFVFYSRYYIQEILLAFFTLGMLACGWRYVRSQRAGWIVLCGLCAGLMIASKETAVLTFASSVVALGLTQLWTRLIDHRLLNLPPLRNVRLLSLALVVALLTACLFLSGMLSNPSGPLDYLRSYTPWLNRAQGTDLHKHPWSYYLHILIWWRDGRGPVWSEGLIVGLAIIGMIASLLPHRRFRMEAPADLPAPESGNGVSRHSQQRLELEGSIAFGRFITFFTLILTAIYGLIPYKTPWCLLSFLCGMILLAGIGATALIDFVPLVRTRAVYLLPGRRTGGGATALIDLVPGRLLKAGVCLLLLLGCAQLGWQSYRTSYLAFTDPHNPYVYAQPSPDMENLAQRVLDLSRSHPQHDQMVIKVFSVDNYYWPLPWYLRRFPNIGYWNRVPADADAPIVLASPEFDDELQKRLNDTHLMHGYFGMRTDVFLEMWVRLDLWKTYLETRKALKTAEPDE